jgi:hypothetical protein
MKGRILLQLFRLLQDTEYHFEKDCSYEGPASQSSVRLEMRDPGHDQAREIFERR